MQTHKFQIFAPQMPSPAKGGGRPSSPPPAATMFLLFPFGVFHPSIHQFICRQVQTNKHKSAFTGRVEEERRLSVKSTHP